MDPRLGTKLPDFANQDKVGGMKFDKYIYSGIVKLNVDPLRMGRLRVWIADMGGNEDDANNWRWVAYASPFYGHTTQNQNIKTNSYKATESTYGMWMVPPDVGNTVLCCFINGDPGRGYWFACATTPKISHGMTPGMGQFTDNKEKSTVESPLVRAAIDRAEPTFLPTAEFNENVKANKTGGFVNNRFPIHEPQAEVLINQGLDTDPVRGATSTSSMREAPSSVFGISTPGRPGDNSKVVPKYRAGGHTFVMDDGDTTGTDQLIRLRTAGGHQILMNDTEQVLYIANSTGTAWMEFGNNGQIHMYANQGFNVRTDGDINMHSKQNINIQGDEVRIKGTSRINLETAAMSVRASNKLHMHSGKIDIGSTGTMSLTAAGTLGVASKAELKLVGDYIRLNDGAVATVTDPGFITANQLAQTTKTANQLYQSNSADSPDHLESIVTTAPDHEPWPRNTSPIPIVQVVLTDEGGTQTISALDVQVAPTSGICADTPPGTGTGASNSPNGAGPLGTVIANYESGPAGYNAFNRGSSPPKGTGSPYESMDIVNMTVQQILDLGNLPQTSDNASKRLFAVGRYQCIPTTLAEAVKKLGIDKNSKFSIDLQDKIFVNHLCKIGSLRAYLDGNSANDSAGLINAASTVAGIWASVEDPKLGRGRYDGVGTNTANCKSAEIQAALKQQYAFLRKGAVVSGTGSAITDGTGNTIQSGVANDDLGFQACAGKEVTQKAPYETMSTSKVPVNGDLVGKGTPGAKNSIPGLTAKQQKALIVEIGYAESGAKVDYKTTDRVGKYAINAVLLAEYGYIKNDYLSKYKLDAINHDAAWTGKDAIRSLDDFLKSATAQDICMVSFVKDAYSKLCSSRGIWFDDSICVAGGMIYVAYFFRDQTQAFGSDVNAMITAANNWRKQNVGRDKSDATPHDMYNRGRYAIDLLSQVAGTGAVVRIADQRTNRPTTGAAVVNKPTVDIDPIDVLVFTTRSGDRAHFDAALSEFQDSILQMAQDYKKQTGRKVTVSSTVRTQQEQQAIYDGWVGAGGHLPDRPTVNVPPYGSISRPVAKVGVHGHGQAMDISPAQAAELEQMGLLAKYGLYRFDPSGDPPHVQPKKSLAELTSGPVIQKI